MYSLKKQFLEIENQNGSTVAGLTVQRDRQHILNKEYEREHRFSKRDRIPTIMIRE